MGVLGVLFWLLLLVMAVCAAAATAVHDEHRQEEDDPQPVVCEELGHCDSFVLDRLSACGSAARIRRRYRIEVRWSTDPRGAVVAGDGHGPWMQPSARRISALSRSAMLSRATQPPAPSRSAADM